MRNPSIAFAGLMPHAPVLVPGVGGDRFTRVAATAAALRRIAADAVATTPDSLVVLSPHSPSRAGAFGLWWSNPLRGSFAMFGAADERVQLPLDTNLCASLEHQAAARGIRTWRIRHTTLDHGALVPLRYLSVAGWRGPSVVVGIQEADPGTLCALGHAIADSAAALNRRVVLIASGDMSHCLRAGAPAGYHPAGEEFDREFICILRAGAGFDDLLALEPALRDQAAEDVVASTTIALAATGDERRGRAILSYEGPFGVGYGVAVLFSDGACAVAGTGGDAAAVVCDPAELPRLARASVIAHFAGAPAAPPSQAAGPLAVPRAVFVTIHTAQDELRGCRGCAQPLADAVRSTWVHAREAAFDDRRFEPVTESELPELKFSVSLLGELEPVTSPAQLDPARYGILVTSADRGRRGLLLPGIPGINSVDQQLQAARRKAEITPDEPITIQRFTSEVHPELEAAETKGFHHVR